MITTETEYMRTFGAASAIRRFAQFVVLGIAAFVRALTHRREVHQLLDLDDRSLRDIGLTRDDVIGALAQPMAKDPSVVLLVRSVDRRSRLRSVAHAARRVKAPEHAGSY
jgi:uncharacterized protein YjiS (DUF1127 family)